MSQFTNTIKEVGKNYGKYDKWEQARADKMAQKEYLVQNGAVSEDKLELTKKRAQTVIRATEIMDTRSENNCENVEQVVGILASVPSLGLAFAIEPANKFIKKSLNNKSKEIKEFLAELEKTNPVKGKELRDFIASKTKRFAYDNLKEPESKLIDKVMKIAEKNSKKAGNISSYGIMGLMFATTIGMILWGNSQQKQASRIGRFQAKQDELKGLQNFVVYTPEQLEEAEKNAKNIPDKKERNNLSQAIYEIKDMQKARGAYNRWAKQKDPNELEKLKARDISSEEMQRAIEDKELITNTVAEINIKAEEFSENLENAFDTFGTLSWLAAVPIGFVVNSLLSKLTQMNKGKRDLVSSVVGLLTGLSISLIGTFEQKNASRIGRYYARKDLTENPHKLLSFTDKEMAEAKDIKAPKKKKGFFEKIGDSFRFLKDYYKQKREFKIYKEKTQKHNEKLQEALKQVQTTEVQNAEAKALQTNVFRAFDEVDEMSQRYSEDIEATTEIAKTTATNLWQLGWMAGTALLTVGVMKGKVTLAKPIKKLSDLCCKKESSIRQSMTNLYEALKNNGKNGAAEFQNHFISGSLKDYLAKPENKNIEIAFNTLKNEFEKVSEKGLMKAASEGKTQNINEVLETVFEDHFKQSKVAKWGRNLTMDIMKLKYRKAKTNELEAIIENARVDGKSLSAEKIAQLKKENREQLEQLGLNGIKNYKTLAWTGAIAGIPILVPLFAVPYMFNAWLTDIQKKAGKIGVMKAMNNLDDPRIFAQTKQA